MCVARLIKGSCKGSCSLLSPTVLLLLFDALAAGVAFARRSAAGQCLHLYNSTVVLATVEELDYMSYM